MRNEAVRQGAPCKSVGSGGRFGAERWISMQDDVPRYTAHLADVAIGICHLHRRDDSE
jgi:hypothetical protein